MELTLAEDGIFPIIYDYSGMKIVGQANTGLNVAGTIQGEGKLNGIPSIFIRLAGCNLRCEWTTNTGVSPCDSAYASYSISKTHKMETSLIYETILKNAGLIKHIVITGGEPMLQISALKELCKLLKSSDFHISIETNATVFDDEIAALVDFFSLSPKLLSSVPQKVRLKESTFQQYNSLRIDLSVIQKFLNTGNQDGKDFQLKFVASDKDDISEIENILDKLTGWKNSDILLMPVGCDVVQITKSQSFTLNACLQHGWRFCDRLHIRIFGDKKGV